MNTEEKENKISEKENYTIGQLRQMLINRECEAIDSTGLNDLDFKIIELLLMV